LKIRLDLMTWIPDTFIGRANESARANCSVASDLSRFFDRLWRVLPIDQYGAAHLINIGLSRQRLMLRLSRGNGERNKEIVR
jgi:hypothetical protein